jgi:hypothetical protein
VAEIAAFIRGANVDHSAWSRVALYTAPGLRPQRLEKSTKAQRISKPKKAVVTVEEMIDAFAQLPSISKVQDALLGSLVEHFGRSGGIPRFLRFEVRDSRVSVFDERQPSGQQRVARIEIPRKQPDVLVRTEIVNRCQQQFAFLSPTPHDKGGHMRRMRVGTIKEAGELGGILVSALSDPRR